TIGATILLTTVAATGLLLATNFSFTNFYENFATVISARFAALRAIPDRFRLWRLARRERREQWLTLKRQARTGGEAVANPETAAATTEIRSTNDELNHAFASFTAETGAPPKTMSAVAGAATASAKRAGWSTRG